MRKLIFLFALLFSSASFATVSSVPCAFGNCIPASLAILSASASCPTGSTFAADYTGSTVGWQWSGNGTYYVCWSSAPINPPAPLVHKYAGSSGGIVCDATGACSGGKVYDTPQAACDSFGTNGVFANSHVQATLIGSTCKTQLIYDDGSKGAPSYATMADAVPCATGDTACAGVKAPANTAAKAGTATAAAADAAAAATAKAANDAVAAAAAGEAARAAAAAKGADAPTQQAAAVAAAAQSAAQAATANAQPPAPKNCDVFADAAACLGGAPAAEVVPSSSPVFSTSPVSFASSASCPADIPMSFTVAGHAFGQSISYAPFCNFATSIRPLFLALAAISSAIIFVAGFMV